MPRTRTVVNGKRPCTKCGEVLPAEKFYTSGKKKDGSYKYNSWCKSCCKEKMASYHKKTWGPVRLQFSAFKRTRSVKAFMSYLLGKAKKRHECSVTVEDLERLWDKQDGKCALTGWQMTMKLGSGNIQTNASVDRIDSGIGYVANNVQLVCRSANVAKSNLSQEDFVKLCTAVAEKLNGVQNRSMAA